jgi:lipoate---protein ligase
MGSIAENLQRDETAWQSLEAQPDYSDPRGRVPSNQPAPTIRLWEPTEVGVVLGRGSRTEHEILLDACRSNAITIHRRLSGGATVVLAPGCLVFTLVLPLLPSVGLHPIEPMHAHILERFVAAFHSLPFCVQRAGTSDLAFQTPEKELKKFSGNSLRVGRRGVLYHGTILYAMDLTWLPRLLQHPPREPTYRESRNHAAFVANLPLPREEILLRIARAWE